MVTLIRIATTRVAIRASKISFHLFARLEYLASTVLVDIGFNPKKGIKWN